MIDNETYARRLQEADDRATMELAIRNTEIEQLQAQRDNLVSAIRQALAVMPIQNNWTYKDVIDILNDVLAAMDAEVKP